jgi:hypothetical protein
MLYFFISFQMVTLLTPSRLAVSDRLSPVSLSMLSYNQLATLLIPEVMIFSLTMALWSRRRRLCP